MGQYHHRHFTDQKNGVAEAEFERGNIASHRQPGMDSWHQPGSSKAWHSIERECLSTQCSQGT